MAKLASVNRELCATARRVLRVRAVAFTLGSLVAVSLAAVGGCDHQVTLEETQAQNVSTAPSANDAGSAADASPTQRCETLLASSLDMMHPDNLEISADVKPFEDAEPGSSAWVRVSPSQSGGGFAQMPMPRGARDRLPAFLKWAILDSNQGPLPYQRSALTD